MLVTHSKRCLLAHSVPSTPPQAPDPATNARAVPIYASTSFVFENSKHGADLFSLKAFGNIYSRISARRPTPLAPACLPARSRRNPCDPLWVEWLWALAT